ncbi:olfactory receptor 12-like [Oryx dammah]|uniref:olfactory receptor 12-like n=1 Tax=Oryx dammah TaxID=59534 RepID=UPI001A9B7FF8|nr:olfactory receptor 12-like [Oryx dammah]
MSPQGDGNLSVMSLQEFVLDGFEGGPQTQALLFALFLALYVVAVLGNLTMMVVITLDARLHFPMYFFLKNLSFVDLCYSSVITPKALVNFLSSSKVITFEGCIIQFFFFSLLGTTEAFLLAVMAYDRFVAICSPLHYPITMRPSVCACLVLGSYCGGCLNSILQASFTFSLPFCALFCPLLTLTSLHRRPEVDEGGGPQHHVIITSTDLVRSPVLPGSTGSWVSHAPPDITGAPQSSLSRAWSASLTGPTDHIAAACTPRLPGKALPLKAASPVILQLPPLKNETALKLSLLSH